MEILPLVWYVLLLVNILYFTILDGATLGLGALSLGHDREQRQKMLEAISPIWYSDETWLVMAAAIFFGAFPVAYAAALSTLYVPIFMIVFGLGCRAASTEFRSSRRGNFWDTMVGVGCLLAILGQGLLLGGLLNGVPIEGGQLDSGPPAWLSLSSISVALAALAAFATLGATSFTSKGGDGLTPGLQANLAWTAVFLFLAMLLVQALDPDVSGLARQWPRSLFLVGAIVSAVISLAMVALAGRQNGKVKAPHAWSVIAFLGLGGTVVAATFPYLIPATLSITNAAAPEAALVFMLFGAGLFVPVVIAYRMFIQRQLARKAR